MLVALASQAGQVLLWEVADEANHSSPWQLNSHMQAVNGVSFHPDDPLTMASCSDDETINVWRCHRGGRVLHPRRSLDPEVMRSLVRPDHT